MRLSDSRLEVEIFLESGGEGAMTVTNSEYQIDTDKARLQTNVIQKFLNDESYWANGRTIDQTHKAIENSICFGVYHCDRQIGFARVVSDCATFAYVGDVFILEEFRGQGFSKWLMETILSHPDLQGLRRWVLATHDAHRLYEKFGFHALTFPERWMEKPAPDAY